jgi:hypothetical protein
LALVSRACNQRLKKVGLGPLPKAYEFNVVAMLAGTAIDYRVRYYFSGRVHELSTILRGRFFFDRLSKKGKSARLVAGLSRQICRESETKGPQIEQA